MHNTNMNIDELKQAWKINNQVNIELLAICKDEDFELKPGKGKTIRSNFVHMVGVRGMWLKTKNNNLTQKFPKLDWKTASRHEILSALNTTSNMMEDMFDQMAASPKPQKTWTVLLFFAYAVAHEAHHRSQIEIALRIHNKAPEDIVLYDLWEWNKKINL